jgi:hypothetical protein
MDDGTRSPSLNSSYLQQSHGDTPIRRQRSNPIQSIEMLDLEAESDMGIARHHRNRLVGISPKC